MAEWQQWLQKNPEKVAAIEHDVRNAYQRGARLNIKPAQVAFGQKELPPVKTRISRQTVLCPSFELATGNWTVTASN